MYMLRLTRGVTPSVLNTKTRCAVIATRGKILMMQGANTCIYTGMHVDSLLLATL